MAGSCRRVSITVAFVALLGGSVPRTAHAAGYALYEQSTRLMSTAYAGTTVVAEDASTGFYNAAGLTRIPYGNITGVGTGYLLSSQFEATSSTTQQPFFHPVVGATENDPTVSAATSAFHLAQRINDDFVFGFGITAPYGLETEYPQDSVVRYIATKSSLITLNLNPNIAWQITKEWSIGGGINIQYMHAELNQAVPPSSLPLGRDGAIKLTGQDWGIGGNIGILYEPFEGTRFGVAWRSFIDYTLTGPVEVFDVVNPAGGNFPNGCVEASLTVPDSVTFSAMHFFTPELQVLFDLAWTHWSVFDNIMGVFDNGLPDDTVLEDWRDAWRASLGAQYFLSDRWTFRGGFAFDQSPVSDSNRTVRLPDANRWFLSLGAGYNITEHIAADLGYMHVFIIDGSVNETAQTMDMSNVQGEYSKGMGNLIGAQLTYRFDRWWPIEM